MTQGQVDIFKQTGQLISNTQGFHNQHISSARCNPLEIDLHLPGRAGFVYVILREDALQAFFNILCAPNGRFGAVAKESGREFITTVAFAPFTETGDPPQMGSSGPQLLDLSLLFIVILPTQIPFLLFCLQITGIIPCIFLDGRLAGSSSKVILVTLSRKVRSWEIKRTVARVWSSQFSSHSSISISR